MYDKITLECDCVIKRRNGQQKNAQVIGVAIYDGRTSKCIFPAICVVRFFSRDL